MAKVKTAKVVEIVGVPGRDGVPSEYSVAIVPGERMTVRCTRKVGSTPTGQHFANYHGSGKASTPVPVDIDRQEVRNVYFAQMERDQAADRLAAKTWCASIVGEKANELAALINHGNWGTKAPVQVPDAIIADWVEEHGGLRHWVGNMIAHEVHEPVMQGYCETYAVGDQAEFDSYNLGCITAITAKTVTVEHGRGDGRKSRLSLYEFCWRNYDSVRRKRKQNAEWMD